MAIRPMPDEDLDLAVRLGLREAGVQGELAYLVGPIKRMIRAGEVSHEALIEASAGLFAERVTICGEE